MRIRDRLAQATSLFREGRYEEVFTLLEPTVQKPGRGRAQKLYLEVLDLAADAADQLGRHREAAQLRRKSLALAERRGGIDPPKRLALARSLAALGWYDQAEEILDEALAGRIDRSAACLCAALKAAVYLRRTQDYEGAAERLRSAWEELPETSSARDRARVGVLRGHALMLAGRLSEAGAVLEEVQKLLGPLCSEDGGVVVEFARCEFFLGDTHRLAGRFGIALESYRRAKRILGRCASAHFTKRYWLRIGAVHFALEEFDRALEAYLHPECIAAVERIGNRRDFVWCYLGAAKALTACGRLEEAAGYLARAREAAGSPCSKFLLGHLFLAKGALLQAQGVPDGADQAFREAEGAFRQVGRGGNVSGIVDALVSQGLLALQRGEKTKAVKIAACCAREAALSEHATVQAQELLLKSALLADGDLEAEGLFKEVLARVECVLSPTVLFKVLANLYHHARKFTDYDLDLALESKLSRLRDAMSHDVYRRLAAAYIDRRFASLILERLTGGTP